MLKTDLIKDVVWFFSRNDAKTVNVITTACFSKVTKVRTEVTDTPHVILAVRL